MTSPKKTHRTSAVFVLRPCAHAVAVSLAMLAGQSAFAQSEVQQTLQRVEITGSSIKRIEGETALPIQTITREDIAKSGATTAAEIIKSISANTAPLSDGASITNVTGGQRGFNGANLRGLGVSSTLVLLNGRRLANFATPGDNAGVDLNNIPAGAIDRVEVLKDGASAIYGTDAIGGVVNFITKKNYQGFDVNAYAGATQEGGAGKRTFTLSGGVGDLETDKYNILAVVDIQKLDPLRSIQRQFIQDRPLKDTLPSYLSSNPFPGNMRYLTRNQWDAFKAAGLMSQATTSYRDNRRVNPVAPDCQSPNVYTPDTRAGVYGCSYDYMRDTEIYPASDKTGIFTRGTFQLAPDHQIFAELLQSKAVTTYRYGAYNATVYDAPIAQLPSAWQNAIATWNANPANAAKQAGSTIDTTGVRLLQAGGRTNEVTSDGTRIVIGASGLFAGWDYDAAYARAENKVTDHYVGGYLLNDKFQDGVNTGKVSLYAPTQASADFLKSITVDDNARNSNGITESVDAKISKPIFSLAGGDAAIALGAEFRRETINFRPSELLRLNNILGDRNPDLASGVPDPDVKPFSDSRNVSSAYAELNAPFSKTVEAQFAVRYDDYDRVGSTINPKAGVRWQPSKAMLVRASAGTGFRAPSLSDLNRPTSFGSTSSILTAPVCAEIVDIDTCTDLWPVKREANPNLKPEKSQQFSLGTVFEPAPGLTLSFDYWNIRKTDVISDVGEGYILANQAALEGKYVFSDFEGFPEQILLKKENQGELRTAGLDLGVDWRGVNTPMGKFGVNMQGTLVLQYDRQFGANTPFVSNLGKYVNDQVIQRWRHRLTFDWSMDAYSLTLGNTYSSDYEDQNLAYDQRTNQLLPANRVQAYSLWDLTGSYKITKDLRVRGGVTNVFNTQPPFSNQSYSYLATYDPNYADPRGRSAFVSLAYSFK